MSPTELAHIQALSERLPNPEFAGRAVIAYLSRIVEEHEARAGKLVMTCGYCWGGIGCGHCSPPDKAGQIPGSAGNLESGRRA